MFVICSRIAIEIEPLRDTPGWEQKTFALHLHHGLSTADSRQKAFANEPPFLIQFLENDFLTGVSD